MDNYITVQPDCAEVPVLLDLFSTSPKVLEKRCINRAPFICIPPENSRSGKLYQACCNDWNCPRCGILRAKHEYGRLVEGAKTLGAQYPLYFQTLTATGNSSPEHSEKYWLEWTNRFNDTFRCHVKVAGGFWAYASVTERQKRGNPHSHAITTSKPADAFSVVDNYAEYVASVQRINEQIPHEMRFSPAPLKDFSHLDMHSEWMCLAAVKAGLGVQCRISEIDTPIAVAKYVAKYMFKSLDVVWPKGWKRIRYSHSWPKLPDLSVSTAFPVITAHDWQKVAKLPSMVEVFDQFVYERALLWECLNVVCRVPNSLDVVK